MELTFEQKATKLEEIGLVRTGDEYRRKDVAIDVPTINSSNSNDFLEMVGQMRDYMLANPTDYPPLQSQELTIIDKAAGTLSAGGKLLTTLQLRVSGFISTKLAVLKADIEKNGGVLNPALAERATKALPHVKKESDEVDEASKEIRQAMVLIRDEFTACTKSLQSEHATIKAFMDAQAVLQKRENDRIAEEARKEAEKKQELINIRAEVEKALIGHFSDHLLSKKQTVNQWFNAITLANIDDRAASLESAIPKYDTAHWLTFKYGYSGRILTTDEVTQIVSEVQSDARLAEFSEQHLNEMVELRAEKRDLIPSKRGELQRIAEFEREQAEEAEKQHKIAEEQKTANDARKAELEREQKQSEERKAAAAAAELEERTAREAREKEEADRTAKEAEESAAAKNRQAEVVAAQETTINLYSQTIGSAPATTGPKTKTVKKATITNPVGIYPVFQLWMENVGMAMTAEDLMSEFSKMFTYASKKANDKLPLLIENEFVQYVDETKAVTERIKKETV